MSKETRPPRGRGMGPVEHAKDFKGTMKKLFSSLGKYKIGIVLVFIFAVLSTIFSIVGPKITGTVTEDIFEGIVAKLSGTGGIDFIKIHKTLLFILGLYIISSICNYFDSYIMSVITQKYTYELRKKIEEKIHKLPLKYFDSKNNGEVLSIATNDVDTLQMSLNQSLVQLITSITTVVGIVIMMVLIDIPMTLLIVLLIPISIVFMAFTIKKSQVHFKNTQTYLGHIDGDIEEMFSGQTVIKAFNAEDKMIDSFKMNNKVLYESNWKSQFFAGLMHPIMAFIGNLGYVAVAIFGGYRCIQGHINVGNIQSFIAYTKTFTQPITQIGQVFNQIQSMIAAAERIFEFLEEEEEVYAKDKLDYKKVLGDVEFDHIKFGYDENIIIKDFSLSVKNGSKIAIVGPTGAGKTTIVKLLMKFYNLNDGAIYLDGKDISSYDAHTLRQAFSMVLQDTWLYSGTIMDNLKYGNLNATDEDVINACKIANAHNFIKNLPDGYNMVIDEDMTNISQGQKQLLTIARAILADSKVLILDEATSSVDTRTEELIQEAMDKLMEGRTSFIIAHRLSTIKNADQIIVMNDGDIIEVGNHKQLLKQDGFYAKLYNSQFDK
jgi:ATP-binding cassette subfamily B protein